MPSLSAPCRSGRDSAIAGASPKAMPVPMATAAVNSNTRQSSPTSATRGNDAGLSASRASMPQPANSTPSPPPMRERTRLSVSSCRTSRQRLAPSAVRMAISFWRAAARASSRLATLAQVMIRTKPTAPSSTSSGNRTLPTIASR